MSRSIVIIGNGVTGITAARHLRKRGNDRILVVSGETDRHYLNQGGVLPGSNSGRYSLGGFWIDTVSKSSQKHDSEGCRLVLC